MMTSDREPGGATAAARPAARRQGFRLVAILLAAAGVASGATVTLPSGTRLRAEVAADPVARARGLLFRSEAEFRPDQAMVFLFKKMEFLGFWMKNVNFAIDMVWLSPENRIVAIEHDAPPCREEPCRIYQPMQKAIIVVELYRGTAKKEGLKLGDELSIEP